MPALPEADRGGAEGRGPAARVRGIRSGQRGQGDALARGELHDDVRADGVASAVTVAVAAAAVDYVVVDKYFFFVKYRV